MSYMKKQELLALFQEMNENELQDLARKTLAIKQEARLVHRIEEYLRPKIVPKRFTLSEIPTVDCDGIWTYFGTLYCEDERMTTTFEISCQNHKAEIFIVDAYFTPYDSLVGNELFTSFEEQFFDFLKEIAEEKSEEVKVLEKELPIPSFTIQYTQKSPLNGSTHVRFNVVGEDIDRIFTIFSSQGERKTKIHRYFEDREEETFLIKRSNWEEYLLDFLKKEPSLRLKLLF